MNCHVIQDLLPLYAEGLTSPESNDLVNAHLENCPDCRWELEQLRVPAPMPCNGDVAPLKGLRKALRQRKTRIIVLCVLVVLIGTLSLVGVLTAPNYLPYGQGLVTVQERETGLLTAHFDGNVTGYTLKESEEGGKRVLYLSAWNSLWDTWLHKEALPDILLNPDGREVSQVYYHPARQTQEDAGQEGILLYGQAADAGVVVLPRLVLGYYRLIALGVLAGLALAAVLLRKREKVRAALFHLTLLPAAYLLASLPVSGIRMISYHAGRDFCLTLLLSLPCYGLLRLAFGWRNRQKNL